MAAGRNTPKGRALSNGRDLRRRRAADIADGKPKTVGSEKVNGIDATIVELSDPSGQGTTRIWLAEKSNYVVKWVTIPKSGGPQTQLEIKNLSFAKLPPSVFVLPAGCK